MNRLYERQLKRQLTQRKLKYVQSLPPVHPTTQKTPSSSYSICNFQYLQDLELTNSEVQTPDLQEFNIQLNENELNKNQMNMNFAELDFNQVLISINKLRIISK
ncbi:Hypothetical_protein [Hexamita inflata]|uniref:Hypothetical_protein n=1 Tax=Hexamita inflata TaxID=28002 RepID=A0AA86U3N6_9EUKA|nr:Hypothetical protein HINF_LOCUS28710 [Hexamita inflata]